MNFYIYTFIFIFGLIIGSFLNVVILRLGKETFTKGRSKCPKCKKTLEWQELIPVLSYVLQLGRCRGCKEKISIQYPLVEFATGALFLLNFTKIFGSNLSPLSSPFSLSPSIFSLLSSPFSLLTIYFLLTSIALAILVTIFVYDWYHKIIPDTLSYTFGILGIIFAITTYRTGTSIYDFDFSKIDLFAPLIFFTPFYLLWRLSRGRMIGLGDGKLSVGIGAFLGVSFGLSAIFLSFWIGAVFAIVLMLINRLKEEGHGITMKSEIAFGPFMIIGFLLVYFLEIDVSGLSLIITSW